MTVGMHMLSTVLVALEILVFSGLAQDQARPHMPPVLDRCWKNIGEPRLQIDTNRNPFYLRADFDGDGIPDYALAVKRNNGTGLLICRRTNGAALLGRSIGGVPMTEYKEDSFLAPEWEVLTKVETREITRNSRNFPAPVSGQKGEALALLFEDGVGVLYFDGRRFRYQPPQQ